MLLCFEEGTREARDQKKKKRNSNVQCDCCEMFLYCGSRHDADEQKLLSARNGVKGLAEGRALTVAPRPAVEKSVI